MKWSTRVGEVSGIGIYIHWTFWIIIPWVLGAYWVEGGTFAAALSGVVLVLLLFGCVVLHELGHALTARRFGIQTRDITLLPIGGVARLERMPEKPLEELWVALAGPAVNVLIAAGLLLLILLLSGFARFSTDLTAFLRGAMTSNILLPLIIANVFLVVFNLIPAFPMDGGRVLRALLATRLDYVRATQLAASLGQGIAILFVVGGLLFALAGFFVSPFLFFIALFVYLGAQQESNVVQMRSLLRGIPLRAAMVTRFRTVDESAPLSAIVQELLAGYQQDFPVVRDGRVVGVLTRSNIMAALAGGPREAQVGQLMRRDCLTADENDMLDQTFERMRETQCSSVPVLRGDTLVGMLTLENVGEWMMVHSALRTGKPNDVLGVTRPDV